MLLCKHHPPVLFCPTFVFRCMHVNGNAFSERNAREFTFKKKKKFGDKKESETAILDILVWKTKKNISNKYKIRKAQTQGGGSSKDSNHSYKAKMVSLNVPK